MRNCDCAGCNLRLRFWLAQARKHNQYDQYCQSHAHGAQAGNADAIEPIAEETFFAQIFRCLQLQLERVGLVGHHFEHAAHQRMRFVPVLAGVGVQRTLPYFVEGAALGRRARLAYEFHHRVDGHEKI